jgi:hypothetical protein
MIDVSVFRDEGPVVLSRGTPIAVDNWNMKDSATYSVAYFPTHETTGAPLVRPTLAGSQDISFPVYTFFKIDGAGEKIKNVRMLLTVETGPEADGAQLFYKMTNIYAEPTKTYDGDMIYLGTAGGSLLQVEFWPMLNAGGPHLATSRETAYVLSSLYTNYFVTQMRVNKGSTVGNTAEFKLKFSVMEFE